MRFSCSLAHFSAAGDGSRLYGFEALASALCSLCVSVSLWLFFAKKLLTTEAQRHRGCTEKSACGRLLGHSCVKTRNRDKRKGLMLKREFITHLRWRGCEAKTRDPRHHERNQTADEDV